MIEAKAILDEKMENEFNIMTKSLLKKNLEKSKQKVRTTKPPIQGGGEILLGPLTKSQLFIF